MRKLSPLLAATCAAGLALPAVAPAKEFRGRSDQGRAVSITTNAEGAVTRAKIGWRATCRRRRGFVYSSSTTFRGPFDTATPDLFADAGRYNERGRRGVIGRIDISINARHRVDAASGRELWRGTLTVRVSVRRNGRLLDSCRVGPHPFTARAV